jgi:hypothetical protein
MNYETEEQKAARNRRQQWEDERAEIVERVAKEASRLRADRIHLMACAIVAGNPGALTLDVVARAIAVVDELEDVLGQGGRY